MKSLLTITALLFAASVQAAPAQSKRPSPAKPRAFVGVIADSMCATKAGHAPMRMGPTDAECATACVDAHGATYMLFDGTTAYGLSDQRTPEGFAGQKVRVSGVLDVKTKTINVSSIRAAK